MFSREQCALKDRAVNAKFIIIITRGTTTAAFYYCVH
jgi:hypothetical protein